MQRLTPASALHAATRPAGLPEMLHVSLAFAGVQLGSFQKGYKSKGLTGFVLGSCGFQAGQEPQTEKRGLRYALPGVGMDWQPPSGQKRVCASNKPPNQRGRLTLSALTSPGALRHQSSRITEVHYTFPRNVKNNGQLLQSRIPSARK